MWLSIKSGLYSDIGYKKSMSYRDVNNLFKDMNNKNMKFTTYTSGGKKLYVNIRENEDRFNNELFALYPIIKLLNKPKKLAEYGIVEDMSSNDIYKIKNIYNNKLS